MKKLLLLLLAVFSFSFAKGQTGCYANFSFSVDSSYTATFADASVPDSGAVITAYSWNFGDGATSTLANPTHNYTTPGTYTVCLITTSNTACSDSVCQTITVGSVDPCAGFSAIDSIQNPSGGGVNDGSVLVIPVGGTGPFSYNWSNGSTNQTLSNVGAGTYTVVVTDLYSGCTYSLTVSLTYSGGSACAANFSFSADSTNTVSFSDLSYSTDSISTIGAWSWNFGDGGTSNVQNPIHLFAGNATTVNVCLTVVSSSGCTNTYCSTITLSGYTNPDPCAGFYVSYTTVNPTPSMQDGSIDITVHNGTNVSYSWSGLPSTEDQSNLGSGSYIVQVSDSAGCYSLATIFLYDVDGSGQPIVDSTLAVNPVDTCFYFTVDTVYIYKVEQIDPTTISVTWAFSGGNYVGYVTALYTYSGQTGQYQLDLIVNCGNMIGSTGSKGASTYSQVIKVTPELINGIKEVVKADFRIYPNPAQDVLNISLPVDAGTVSTYRIINSLGQLIVEGNLSNTSINVKDLTKGTYYLNVISKNGNVYNKVFIK
jgi:PKD repeat protein